MKVFLSDRINIKSLLIEYQIENYDFVNCSIGNDYRIYLLYSSQIPSRIEKSHGSFVSTTSGSDYKSLVLNVDWDLGGVLHYHLIDFGKIEPNVFLIQPIENNYLLLGSRATRFKDGTSENNAIILDENRNIIKSMCLGDGIQDCIVDYENDIITSYFDEGVFGNYGWGDGAEPLGSHGIVKWSPIGEKLWEDKNYGICDCYAMNIDERNHLWFYYYTEFNLVQTDFCNDRVYDPQINGAANFLIRRDYSKIIFDKGYDKHGSFCVKSFSGERLSNKAKDCSFIYDNQKISGLSAFRGSKAVFIDREYMLYYVDWDKHKTE